MSPIYNPYSGNYIQNETSLFDNFISAIKTTAAIKRLNAETEQMNIKNKSMKAEQDFLIGIRNVVYDKDNDKYYRRVPVIKENPDRWTNLWGILPKGETQQGWKLEELDLSERPYFEQQYIRIMGDKLKESQLNNPQRNLYNIDNNQNLPSYNDDANLKDRWREILKSGSVNNIRNGNQQRPSESFIDYNKRENYDPLFQMDLGPGDKGQENLLFQPDTAIIPNGANDIRKENQLTRSANPVGERYIRKAFFRNLNIPAEDREKIIDRGRAYYNLFGM